MSRNISLTILYVRECHVISKIYINFFYIVYLSIARQKNLILACNNFITCFMTVSAS